MNLKSLDNEKLLNHTKTKSIKERKLTFEVIECLQEIYVRRIHLEMGYSSLHTFCTSELKYSDTEAHYRINAMKLVEELPETKNSILEGKLTLTSAAQVQTFFSRQEKQERKLLLEAKRQIVKSIECKSKQETEKELTLSQVSKRKLHRAI